MYVFRELNGIEGLVCNLHIRTYGKWNNINISTILILGGFK